MTRNFSLQNRQTFCLPTLKSYRATEPLLSYRGDVVKTMTTNNGDGLPAHGNMTKDLEETAVCFTDSCHSQQKGVTIKTDKLIRQSMPFGTDCNDLAMLS